MPSKLCPHCNERTYVTSTYCVKCRGRKLEHGKHKGKWYRDVPYWYCKWLRTNYHSYKVKKYPQTKMFFRWLEDNPS